MTPQGVDIKMVVLLCSILEEKLLEINQVFYSGIITVAGHPHNLILMHPNVYEQ
jgi:hypothetical protein